MQILFENSPLENDGFVQFQKIRAEVLKLFEAEYIEVNYYDDEIESATIGDYWFYHKGAENSFGFIHPQDIERISRILTKECVETYHQRLTFSYRHRTKSSDNYELYDVVLFRVEFTDVKKIQYIGYERNIQATQNLISISDVISQYFSCTILVEDEKIIHSICNEAEFKDLCDLYEDINEFLNHYAATLVSENDLDTFNKFLVPKRPGKIIYRSRDERSFNQIELKDVSDGHHRNLYLYLIKDITEERNLLLTLKRLKSQSKKESFTGLITRKEAEIQYKKLKGIGFFAILDIDKFKNINDTYGHFIGDQVILHLAKIIKHYFKRDFIKIRMGGDEFAIIGKNIAAVENIEDIFFNFFVLIEKNDFLSRYSVSCSVGLKVFNEKMDFKYVYQEADYNLYKAKKVKGNFLSYVIT